jgi:hypothetical protein
MMLKHRVITQNPLNERYRDYVNNRRFAVAYYDGVNEVECVYKCCITHTLSR